MIDSFLDSLAEVVQDEITISSSGDNVEVEARANQWSFSISPEQAKILQPYQIVHFITTIMEAREDVLRRHKANHAMIFYCWFDDQAAQLRLSVVSAHHGILPFGCRLRYTTELGEIVDHFLRSPYHGGIQIKGDLQTEDKGEEQTEDVHQERFVLDVWSVNIPRYNKG
jgi:hypothetical protein